MCSLIIRAFLLLSIMIGVVWPPATAQAQGGVTQHLVLRPSDFLSTDAACNEKTGAFLDAVAGVIGGRRSGTCATWVANIHVPDGATLTQLKVAYRDSAQFANFFIAVTERTLFSTDGVDTALSGQLPDPGNAFDAIGTLNGQVPIDNVNSHYQLVFTVDIPELIFIAAALSYNGVN
jgi:hypothetical protein